MIDSDLLNKFDRIQDLPVSEEMLGAYVEGNLSDPESIEVSTLIDTNPDLSFLSFEIASGPLYINSESIMAEYPELSQYDFPNVQDSEIGISLPFLSEDMQMITLCDSQIINGISELESSNAEDIPVMDENNILLHDSSDTDYQSLNTDPYDGTDDNMFKL